MFCVQTRHYSVFNNKKKKKQKKICVCYVMHVSVQICTLIESVSGATK